MKGYEKKTFFRYREAVQTVETFRRRNQLLNVFEFPQLLLWRIVLCLSCRMHHYRHQMCCDWRLWRNCCHSAVSTAYSSNISNTKTHIYSIDFVLWNYLSFFCCQRQLSFTFFSSLFQTTPTLVYKYLWFNILFIFSFRKWFLCFNLFCEHKIFEIPSIEVRQGFCAYFFFV